MHPGGSRARRLHFLFVGNRLRMPEVEETLAGQKGRFHTLADLVRQAEAPAYLAASDLVLSPHVPNEDGTPFFGSPTKLSSTWQWACRSSRRSSTRSASAPTGRSRLRAPRRAPSARGGGAARSSGKRERARRWDPPARGRAAVAGRARRERALARDGAVHVGCPRRPDPRAARRPLRPSLMARRPAGACRLGWPRAEADRLTAGTRLGLTVFGS